MAFRRFRFLSLVLAILALALVGAGCGGDDGGGDGGGGGGGGDDASALLKKAFETDVKSADLTVTASGEASGSDAGKVSVKLSGPYESQGANKLPLLDWDVSVSAQGTTFDGGLIVTKDNAFVSFRGQTYEVGKQLFSQYTSQLEKQSSDGPKSLSDLGIDPAGWLNDPKVEDGEEIGGDSTKLVSGSVNIRKIIDDVFKALQNPAIKQQLESQGNAGNLEKPSEKEIKEVEDAIKSLNLEVNVDDDDRLRRFDLAGDFANPEKKSETGKGSVEVRLESVGESADIKAPSGARPITELLQQFGALGAGGAGGLGGSTGP